MSVDLQRSPVVAWKKAEGEIHSSHLLGDNIPLVPFWVSELQLKQDYPPDELHHLFAGMVGELNLRFQAMQRRVEPV